MTNRNLKKFSKEKGSSPSDLLMFCIKGQNHPVVLVWAGMESIFIIAAHRVLQFGFVTKQC